MITKTFIVALILGGLFLVIACFFSSCKQRNDDGRGAGLAYCMCLKKHQAAGRDFAVRFCKDSLKKEYRFLSIYLETRDKIPTETYPKSTIDSMMVFIAAYAQILDSCRPPFWLKE